MSKNTIDYEALLPNIPYEDVPIPKRIHQIFLGKPADQLPDAMKENVQYICRINPDWEYHLWSEEDIDSFILGHYNKEILRYFRMIPPTTELHKQTSSATSSSIALVVCTLTSSPPWSVPLMRSSSHQTATSSTTGIMMSRAATRASDTTLIYPEIASLMASSIRASSSPAQGILSSEP